jgi:hypothetical protein
MRIAVFGLLIGTLCLAACDDTDNSVVVHLPQRGAFALRTVDDRALPALIVDSLNPQFRLEIVSGGFSINTNGTFSTLTQFRETRGLVIVLRSVACSGTYTASGNDFAFTNRTPSVDCAGLFTGVVAGNILSTTIRGFPAIYSR